MFSRTSYSFSYCFSLCFVLFHIHETQSQVGWISYAQCYRYRFINFNNNNNNIYTPLIVGGTQASSAEFPHMAALGYGNETDPKWNCGGTLISDRFVLTAAHCMYSRNDGELIVVRLGTTNVVRPESSYKDYKIAQKIKHPDYKFPQKYHDIALLRLNTVVQFNEKIKPACLQINDYINENHLVATGWGSEYTGGPFSPVLLKVNLVAYPMSICTSFYANQKRDLPNGVQEKSMICAGGNRGESKDTCIGDSGGPLQNFRNSMYYIVGVTSFGKACGLPNVPAIYTKVSYYVSWIEKTVWN